MHLRQNRNYLPYPALNQIYGCDFLVFRQFRYYRSKLSQIARGKVTPKADKVATTSPFAPVIIKPGSTEPSNIPVQPQPVAENFTLEFAGGMRCRIPTNFNPASLRQLVAALR